MDFEAVLGQILHLVQSQGRVSYRAIKRRFDLDDPYLEDVKEEILFAHPHILDEEGRGLVWTGPETASVTTLPADEPADPPAAAVPSASRLPAPDAERRQLTVMFCDLVGSTALSGQLDPEVLREVIRAYQAAAAEVIERFDGHIAQYLGDGLLVYLGWPHAHEDDALRAVHAGLGILDALPALNRGLVQRYGVQLTVRIGIHTGPVVIGDMGGGRRHEQLAQGETPNIAARLEGLAAPNTLLLSATTWQLVAHAVQGEDLGAPPLKGVTTPMHVFRVHGLRDTPGVPLGRGRTPLVGREQELGVLRERWVQVQDGVGQVVLLSGEAGVGKSRLVQRLTEDLATVPHTRLEGRSSPYYQHTALYPLCEMLRQALQWHAEDSPAARLVTLERHLDATGLPLADAVPLFAALLDVPLPEERYPPLALTSQQQRRRTLDALLAWLLALTTLHPLLLIIEDLHWTDPSTLEFLGNLLDQAPTARILVLLTCRPEFTTPWGLRAAFTPLGLQRLSRGQSATLIAHLTGDKTLPAAVVQHLVEKTDGVPLYLEEITKAVLESGVLRDTEGQYTLTEPLASLTIPLTLHDALMARLDRLGAAKGVAQLGAMLGRTFSYALLQAVSALDELAVWQHLVALVDAELLYQRGSLPQATFIFKHALIQEVAYQSLLRSTRQQQHAHIAQILEAQFADLTATQPELLAHHYTAAGRQAQAVRYWQRAGDQAIQRSAHAEAVAHLSQGLASLQTLPDTAERARHELTLQRTLGVSLQATKGFSSPEVGVTYSRARDLCEQLGETDEIYPVLFGLWGFHHLRLEWSRTRDVAQQLLTLASQQQDAGPRLIAHRAMGDTLYWLGEFVTAHAHLEQGIALYDAEQHRAYAYRYGQDPLMGCQAYMAKTLWQLGYPDQALRQIEAAVAWSQHLAHPFSLGLPLTFAGTIHRLRGEQEASLDFADRLEQLGNEQGFAQCTAQGVWARGHALVMLGRQEGIVQALQGGAGYQATGARSRPFAFAERAPRYHRTGHTAEALRVALEGLAVAEETGDGECVAELHRLKGEFLLALSEENRPEATASFVQALDIARAQHSKAWELRAATSLARLWQQQGKRQEAYDLLAPVYRWFTEGFDTADLQEARALLDTLAPR